MPPPKNRLPAIDEYITLPQAAAYVPGRSKGNRSTRRCIEKWVYQGIRGNYLKATMVGNHMCTTRAWLGEFVRECTRTRNQKRSVQRHGPNGFTKALEILDGAGV